MQIVHILAGTEGFCDEIDNNRVPAFITDLTAHFEKTHTQLLDAIKAPKATMKKSDCVKIAFWLVSKISVPTGHNTSLFDR